MMKFKVFCLIFITLVYEKSFSQVTFLNYCKQYQNKKTNINANIAHTVKVLYRISQQKSCEEAFDLLSRLKFLDLSRQGLNNLLPLSGLRNIRSLDISHNNLSDLWGLSSLNKIEILIANNNKLENIAPVVFLKSLKIVDLKDNHLRYASPLKELFELTKYYVEGNPLFFNEEEMDYLNSMIFFRKLQKRGLNYTFNLEKDSLEDLMIQVFMAADRGDLPFFRKILGNSELNAQLTDKYFLLSSPVKTQKVILAVNSAKNLAYELIEHFVKVKKISELQRSALFDVFRERRKQLSVLLEYFLSEGQDFPRNFSELKALKAFLLLKIEATKKIDPASLEGFIKEWLGIIYKTGIPPSLQSGFIGM